LETWYNISDTKLKFYHACFFLQVLAAYTNDVAGCCELRTLKCLLLMALLSVVHP